MDNKVTIYTRHFCGYSSRAVNLLERKGIPFEEVDVSNEPSRRAEMIERAGGQSTFPQVFIGERHIGGSDELHELDEAGELDALLGVA